MIFFQNLYSAIPKSQNNQIIKHLIFNRAEVFISCSSWKKERNEKTDRGATCDDVTITFAVQYELNGHSLREAEKEFGINYRTVGSYFKRHSRGTSAFGYGTPGKILPESIKNDLVQYAKKAFKIFYGLTNSDLRVLAFRVAVANNIKIPPSSKTNEQAGVDWLQGFMSRHRNYYLYECLEQRLFKEWPTLILIK